MATRIFQLALLLPVTHAWIENRVLPRFSYGTRLFALESGHQTTEHSPCWQDIFDEDCSMDNAYAASFVASEWLMQMPCAHGLEDCDMPDDLKLPGNRHTEAFSEVDVMEFLNLKRARPIQKTVDGKKLGP